MIPRRACRLDLSHERTPYLAFRAHTQDAAPATEIDVPTPSHAHLTNGHYKWRVRPVNSMPHPLAPTMQNPRQHQDAQPKRSRTENLEHGKHRERGLGGRHRRETASPPAAGAPGLPQTRTLLLASDRPARETHGRGGSLNDALARESPSIRFTCTKTQVGRRMAPWPRCHCNWRVVEGRLRDSPDAESG